MSVGLMGGANLIRLCRAGDNKTGILSDGKVLYKRTDRNELRLNSWKKQEFSLISFIGKIVPFLINKFYNGLLFLISLKEFYLFYGFWSVSIFRLSLPSNSVIGIIIVVSQSSGAI